MCFPERRNFIQKCLPGRAAHNHAAAHLQALQNSCNLFAKLRARHADQLDGRPRRVQERSENIEDRALAAFGTKFSRRGDMLEHRMKMLREEKGKIVFRETPRGSLATEVNR